MFGWLFQQYVIDQYAKVESERLRWYRDNQDDFLTANFQGLADAYSADDGAIPGDVSRRPFYRPHPQGVPGICNSSFRML